MRPSAKALSIPLSLESGRTLRGVAGDYKVVNKIHREVWTAVDESSNKVIVKTPPRYRLHNEREVLQRMKGNSSIRPMVDTIQDPPALILRYLDGNLLEYTRNKQLKGHELKFVARKILEALSALHEAGYVHTGSTECPSDSATTAAQDAADVKPDNILFNRGDDSTRFSEIQLGDCGDVYRVKEPVDPLEEGHLIGVAIFRSPEANLRLRWGPPTDIWSFGATLISLIWGYNWHIFRPDGIKADDERYTVAVLIEQVRRFGPAPVSYQDIAGDGPLGVLAYVINFIEDHGLRRPFYNVVDEELTTEDMEFLLRFMKLDPRDRPTAQELLKDEWFEGR